MQLEDDFGDIVAKARIGSAISAAQLAQAAGLPERDIARIESYELVPDDKKTELIAEALNLGSAKLAAIARGQWVPQLREASTEAISVRGVHVPFGMYGENAYVLGCNRTHLGAVIDPGGAVEEIIRHLSDLQLSLELVLITHAHADHIGGLRELMKSNSQAAVFCSPVDRAAVTQDVCGRWLPAEDGARFELGEIAIEALATPGHTPGAVCYSADGACFVGDTLFAGSIGRPASSDVYPGMLSAIMSKVLSLSGETILLPGHGCATTVAEELEHNPFF